MWEWLLRCAILVLGYALAILCGGWLVAWVLAKAGMSGRLSVASKFIGWFERFLIVTFGLSGEWTAVGFVVAAKSLLRFGESREDREFAQYVLLGTLASVSVALAATLLLRYLLPRI